MLNSMMACDLFSAACFAATSPPNSENDIQLPLRIFRRGEYASPEWSQCRQRAAAALGGQRRDLAADAKIRRAFPRARAVIRLMNIRLCR
jgi:hypothetical protein